MRELFQGLPVRLASRLLDLSRWKRILWIIVLLIAGNAIGGVIEGEGFDFWRVNIRPWFAESYPDWVVTKGLLFASALGWLMFLLILPVTILIYGADRRRLGQLETVGKENAEREMLINSLTAQVAELSAQIEANTKQLAQAEKSVAAHIRDSQLVDIITQIDRELFTLVHSTSDITDVAEDNFLYSVVRRMFQLFNNEVYRACLYLPDVSEPDYISIVWDHGVGEQSRAWNRWYVGPMDPTTTRRPRGVAGSVFCSAESRVCPDVRLEPDFHDPYRPQRPNLPYKSTLNILVHPDDKTVKIGVLCIDSAGYKFTEKDKEMSEMIATRVGWLLYIRMTRQQRMLSAQGGD
jgi:hypothetical protein